MALDKGYDGIVTWDTDHVLQTRADITLDTSRGRIDITVHGASDLPFRTFSVGLYDPIEMTIPMLWDYTRAEVAEIMTAYNCGSTTKVEFEDDTDSAHPHITGMALVTGIGMSARMENEVQIMNVTFLFSGAPSYLFGVDPNP